MDKDSVLYLLMDMRVNGILDRILKRGEEYLEIRGIFRQAGGHGTAEGGAVAD